MPSSEPPLSASRSASQSASRAFDSSSSTYCFSPIDRFPVSERPPEEGVIGSTVERRLGDAVNTEDSSVLQHHVVSEVPEPLFDGRFVRPLGEDGEDVDVGVASLCTAGHTAEEDEPSNLGEIGSLHSIDEVGDCILVGERGGGHCRGLEVDLISLRSEAVVVLDLTCEGVAFAFRHWTLFERVARLTSPAHDGLRIGDVA